MPSLEEKKIVINLPQFHWRFFTSLRFFLLLTALVSSCVCAYWYKAIRPFLWTSAAHVEAYSTVVSSDLAGRIIQIGPQEGDFVRQGETLAILDRDLILAKQAQLKLSIQTIEQQIEKEKERIGKAMEEYLVATSELEIGIGSAETVKKQLALMDEAQEKSEAASSQLASIQAELSHLDLQVKKLTLTAPFDAIVLKRMQNQGSVVSFGDPIYVLCDPEQVWIEAEIPEQELSHLSLGSAAKVRLPAYPKRELVGKISYIAPATKERSSLLYSAQKPTIPIRVSVDSKELALKPGLSASIGLKVR